MGPVVWASPAVLVLKLYEKVIVLTQIRLTSYFTLTILYKFNAIKSDSMQSALTPATRNNRNHGDGKNSFHLLQVYICVLKL